MHLSVETIKRARSAVYHTRGITLRSLVEDAINYAVDHLEKERGEEFPPFDENLKGAGPSFPRGCP